MYACRKFLVGNVTLVNEIRTNGIYKNAKTKTDGPPP